MIAIDTETTGLWWQHDTEMFALGTVDEDYYNSTFVPVDPLTRKPEHGWSKADKHDVQNFIYGKDPVVFQNAKFDVKALCKAGFFDWHDPGSADFWENIIELGHLTHLHDSTDAKFSSSLKKLTPKYLDGDYASEDELLRIVNRCRTFVKNRDPLWATGSHLTIPQAKPKDSFNKTDMWLPAALLRHWRDQRELQSYMKDDYELFPTLVDTYLKDDCRNTLALAQGFTRAILEFRTPGEAEQLLQMNRDLMPVVWKMEILGVAMNKDQISRSLESCEHWMKYCHKECEKVSGLSVTSFTPAILCKVLYEDFELEPTRFTTKTNKPSTDKTAREELKRICDAGGHTRGSAFLTHFIAYSKYQTKHEYLTAYQRSLQQAGNLPYSNKASSPDSWFAFPSLNESGTGTTRFSSSQPFNSQNIEKTEDPFAQEFEDVADLLAASPSLRSVFIPENASRWWIPIDYSQLQLRIFAAATQDPALIQSFRDGYDFHDFMAHVIFDLPDNKTPTVAQRRIAKNVNFGFIFGASPKKIDQTAQRKGLYSYLMDCFPHAREFIESTKETIASNGLVHTLGGYPLKIPLTASPWGGMSFAAHMGVNYIVQGTEGEIVKRAMVLTDRYLTEQFPAARLVMQIHDEIVFDTPARPPKHHVASLCQLMEQAGSEYGVETPVDPELCMHNLSQKKKIKLLTEGDAE